MGRHKKRVDDEALLQMRLEGKTQKEIASTMGVAVPTIARRVAVLRHHEGILTKYRELQGLQLTGLQARILETVDLKNIEDASLNELIRAFHVLKKAEIAIQGKDSIKVTGLVEHLIYLEKLEKEET